MKRTVVATALAIAGLVLAAPAHADVDTDFNNELHTYGIYAGKDYNAWIGKLTCKRLDKGLDADNPRNLTRAVLLTDSTPRQGV